MTQTQQAIKEIVVEQLYSGPDHIELDSNLQDDLGADSLDLSEIALTISDEFDVTIPHDSLEELQTIEALASFVDRSE